jgi:hypothetical protein
VSYIVLGRPLSSAHSLGGSVRLLQTYLLGRVSRLPTSTEAPLLSSGRRGGCNRKQCPRGPTRKGPGTGRRSASRGPGFRQAGGRAVARGAGMGSLPVRRRAMRARDVKLRAIDLFAAKTAPTLVFRRHYARYSH